MVSSLNPTGVTYTISLNNNSTESAKLTKALAKNQNPNISVVSAINGRQLSSSAKIGTKIVENMGTARALFATALAATGDLIAQLEEMKGELQDLNDAGPQVLAIGQTNYVNEVARINDILATTNFNGKNLFDGTLASGPRPNTNIPNTAAPYRNQIDFNSFLNTTIARLLPGDGTIVDVSTPGQLEPLFPNLNSFYVPQNTKGNSIKAAISVPTVSTIAQTILAVGAVVTPPGAEIKNFATAVDNFVDAEKSIPNAGGSNAAAVGGRLDTFVDAAGAFLEAACVANPAATVGDITTAVAAIKAVYAAAVAANGSADTVRNVVRDMNVAYPVGANEALKSVYDSLSTAAKSVAVATITINGSNDSANAGTALKNALNVSINGILANQVAPSPEGTVLTAAGRIAATALLNRAVNTLNGIQAQIIGQQANLEKAKDSMNVQVTELSAAASNLLSADYEKIVPKLTQLLREAKVLSLAFGLSERQINTVISQLEATAAAA